MLRPTVIIMFTELGCVPEFAPEAYIPPGAYVPPGGCAPPGPRWFEHSRISSKSNRRNQSSSCPQAEFLFPSLAKL